MQIHPKVREIGLPRGLGDFEAEQMLRVLAATEPDRAKRQEYAQAVAEIDQGRAKAKADASACMADMSKRLGLSPDQLREQVAVLAGDAELWTWLTRRVQETTAHGRPLEHDE